MVKRKYIPSDKIRRKCPIKNCPLTVVYLRLHVLRTHGIALEKTFKQDRLPCKICKIEVSRSNKSRHMKTHHPKRKRVTKNNSKKEKK